MAREGDPPRRRFDLPRAGVLGIDDGEILRPLVLEDPLLDPRVCLEVPVPVEVVGRDVGDDRDVRAEPFDRLELKGRDLADEVSRSRVGQERRERHTDVPRQGHRASRAAQDFGDPGRRRGLAVCARYRDPSVLPRLLLLGDAPGDLELRQDRDAPPARRRDGGRIERDSGRDREPAGSLQKFHRRPVEEESRAPSLQLLDRGGGEPGAWPGVSDRQRDLPIGQGGGERAAAARKAQDRHASG